MSGSVTRMKKWNHSSNSDEYLPKSYLKKIFRIAPFDVVRV